MRLLIALMAIAAIGITDTYAQSYKIVTVVESIVPMGIGRSRIIETKENLDASSFTTERSEGNDSKQNEVNRKDLKAMEFEETKLLNFFSGVGINFRNIASNDALIASKINQLMSEGYNLQYVTSGVESNAGEQDGQGIFITRLFFFKPAPATEATE